MKRKIILLAGIPGAGKTTLLSKFDNKLFNIISPDKIRESYGEVLYYNEKEQKYFIGFNQRINNLVFDEAEKKAEWFLNNKPHIPIVIDATNINKKFRIIWKNLAIKYNAEYNCIWLNVDLETAKRQNLQRLSTNKFVPTDIIEKYFNNQNYSKNEFDNFIEINNHITEEDYNKINKLFNNETNLGNFFVVGDIHGNFDIFVNLIKKVGFTIDENNKINHPDNLKLVILGDFVDRGLQSLELIKFFMKNKKNIIVIKGNHEAKIVKLLTDKRVRQFHINQVATLRQLSKLPQGYINNIVSWLDNLPTIIHNKNYIFTHAGLLSDDLHYLNSSLCVYGYTNKDPMYIDQYYKGKKILFHGHVSSKVQNDKVYNLNTNLDDNQITIYGCLVLNKNIVKYSVSGKNKNILKEKNKDWEKYHEIFIKYVPKGLVAMKKSGRYIIFQYTAKTMFNNKFDKITKRTRGLVYDTWTAKFVVKPFYKFFNDTEEFHKVKKRLVNNIPFKIYTKENGFLFNVTKINNEMIYSCSGSLGDDAEYVKLAKEIIEKNNYNLDIIENNKTYMFEAITPKDKHYVDYENKYKLFLLAIRDINTEKISRDVEHMASLIKCDFAKEISKEKFYTILKNDVKPINFKTFSNMEGFVVVFDDGYTVKVKLFSYLYKKCENRKTKFNHEYVKIRKKIWLK